MQNVFHQDPKGLEAVFDGGPKAYGGGPLEVTGRHWNLLDSCPESGRLHQNLGVEDKIIGIPSEILLGA